MLMIEKMEHKLECVPCIWYFVDFKDWIEALLDSKNKINAMSQAFASQLGLKICKTKVWAQKIDGITFETNKMVNSLHFFHVG